MAYIDKTYYDETYKGVPIDNADTFSRLSERASDMIDQITGYKIKDINDLTAFQQSQVKKATAAQTEFLAISGSESAVHGDSFQSVGIGSFNYSKNTGESEKRISPSVVGYLKQTGLLYSGVSVYDSAYSVVSPYPYSHL